MRIIGAPSIKADSPFRRHAPYALCWPMLLLAASLVSAAPSAIGTDATSQEEPRPLDAQRARSEREEERLQAAALFATGRMLLQKEKQAEALRFYQRAHRFDPASGAILAEIVPLAFRMGREEEAVRYALIAQERTAVEPELARRLATHLSERGEFERAARLYGRLLPAIKDDQPDLMKVFTHLQAGRMHYLVGDHAEASAALALVERALIEPKRFGISQDKLEVLQGEAGLTWQLIGLNHLEARRPDDAQRAFRRMHVVQPNSALLGYQLARVEAQRKNLPEARRQLEKYLAADARSEGQAPYELLVRLAREQGQPGEAIARLTELVEQHPDNQSLSLVLAREHLAAENWLQALAFLEKTETALREADKQAALQTHILQLKGYARLRNAEGLLDSLRKIVRRANTLQSAEESLQELLTDKPLLEEVLALGRARAEQDDPRRRVERAEESFALAHLALWSERVPLASELFLQAEERLPERGPEWQLAGGLAFFLNDEPAAAAEVFRRGAENKAVGEQRFTFYYYLAGALQMAERTDEALDAARQAAGGKDVAAEYAARVAWIQYYARRYDDALASYRKLLAQYDQRRDSSETRETLRSARLAMSTIHVIAERLDEAEELLQQVLDEFPEDVGAMNDLGYLWVDQNKNLTRSLRMISRAVEAEPDNTAYLDSLGWAHYRLGNFALAVEHLEAASAGEEADATILDHLGDAYQAHGRHQRAVDAWRRARAAFEKEGESEKANLVDRKLSEAGEDGAPEAEQSTIEN